MPARSSSMRAPLARRRPVNDAASMRPAPSPARVSSELAAKPTRAAATSRATRTGVAYAVMVPTPTSAPQARLFIQDELDSAALYEELAAHEADHRLADVYRRLAATERRHADHWIEKLKREGLSVPVHRIGWRARVLRLLARRF